MQIRIKLIVLFVFVILYCASRVEGKYNGDNRAEESAKSSRSLFGQNWRRKVFHADPTSKERTVVTPFDNSSFSDLQSSAVANNESREGKCRDRIILRLLLTITFLWIVFGLFTVIKFANDECSTLTNENGTCYSAQECRLRQGIASGVCAGGFGVCCTCNSAVKGLNCRYPLLIASHFQFPWLVVRLLARTTHSFLIRVTRQVMTALARANWLSTNNTTMFASYGEHATVVP